MSDLYPASSLFQALSENDIHMGGIQVDTGLHAHLIEDIDQAKQKDQRVLGREGEPLTVNDFAVLLVELDQLADDLDEKYERTFAAPFWNYDEASRTLKIRWIS